MISLKPILFIRKYQKEWIFRCRWRNSQFYVYNTACIICSVVSDHWLFRFYQESFGISRLILFKLYVILALSHTSRNKCSTIYITTDKFYVLNAIILISLCFSKMVADNRCYCNYPFLSLNFLIQLT